MKHTSKDMRICILGSYNGMLDEGMANVSYNVYDNLRATYPNTTMLNLKNVYTAAFWRSLISIRPDIIHYIPGPTTKGLILTKLMKIMLGSRIVVLASKPVLPEYFKRLSSILKPDIMIVQSQESESFFKRLDYETIFIPNGVDAERFQPVDVEKKIALRKRYGFAENDFIVLHIGPARRGRNQKALLAVKDAKILMIVSVSNPSEEDFYRELKSTNAVIWREYFPNIQDIYAMSDVYLFPVFDQLNSIEIPLSVLEAMACNLPVITTRYGGLAEILKEGDGLFFIESEGDIQVAIDQIRKGVIARTREKIQKFSWRSIMRDISKVYEGLWQVDST